MRIWLFCLIVFLLSGFPGFSAPAVVPVDYRLFPNLAAMDGNWSALLAASTGKVYAGLAYHGSNGHLVEYNPATDQMRDLGNLTELCREQNLNRGPQSKIHTKFGEGKDGRIYFATHYGLDFNYSRHARKEGYPGSHFMVYDPKTNLVRDLGIGIPFDGLVTGAYDPRYERMYGITDPRGHFIYYDMAKRKAVDKGRFNNPESLCRTLGIDDEGNVFGTLGMGQIFRYDPRSDEVVELPLHIPIRPKGISLGRDYHKSETHWRTVIWDNQEKRFYGVDESASFLFSFAPRVGGDGEVRLLGQMIPAEKRERRDIAYATLALTMGADRKLYYAIPEKEFDYGASSGIGVSHLITYDLKEGRISDLGELRLADGAAVIGLNSASTAADGTIYFVGAIELREQPGRKLEYAGKIGNVPYRLALVIYRPPRQP